MSPVMLLTELPDNTNTSVTNMLEYLVAEIGTLLMPHRFDDDEPFTVIEHYPAQPGHQRASSGTSAMPA